MATARFLCDQGFRELQRDKTFDGSKRCRIIDIRLSNNPRHIDNFVPGHGPASSSDSVPENLVAWAEDEASHFDAVSHTHKGRLLVAYHVWDRCDQKVLPFQTAESFHTFLGMLRLPKTFAWDFARKTPISLLKEEKDHAFHLTCQTPHFGSTTLSLTTSYLPETKTTTAFVVLCSGEMQYFIDTLRELAQLCASPLLLPTLFYLTMASLLSKRMAKAEKKLRDVEIHNQKLKHIHRGEQSSKDQDCDRDHMDLVEAHYELTRGLAEFVEDLEPRLCKLSWSLGHLCEQSPQTSSTVVASVASESISESDLDNLPISGALPYENKELNQLIRRTHYSVQADLLKRKRLERRVEVQMQVLYNLKQTRIAEATYTDSAAMKSLALLTMIFLPPNAVATIFGANSFFTTLDGTVTGVTRTFSTVFVPTSILVVTVVAVSWVLYTYWYDMKDWLRKRQGMSRKANVEVQKYYDGVCAPQAQRTPYDVENEHGYQRSEAMRLWPIRSITSSDSPGLKYHHGWTR